MSIKREWDVLMIGGSSGSGKTSIAYELAHFYQLNVVKVDTIGQALKAMTTAEILPALHYWDTGINWKEVGVAANVEWLIKISKEISPAIKAVVDMHIEDSESVIIEGDFIHPELCASFADKKVKSIFVRELDVDQISQNYLGREGMLQPYRAEISRDHGNWLAETCIKYGIAVVESRPWDTLLDRVNIALNKYAE